MGHLCGTPDAGALLVAGSADNQCPSGLMRPLIKLVTRRRFCNGRADAAVERHDGAPPGEDEIVARMRAEGLSPHGWGNGPGDTYDWHEHGYEKVLYCVRGQIVTTLPAVTSGSARETRWCSRHTPCMRQRAAPGGGGALHRSAPPARRALTDAGDGVPSVPGTSPLSTLSPARRPHNGKEKVYGMIPCGAPVHRENSNVENGPGAIPRPRARGRPARRCRRAGPRGGHHLAPLARPRLAPRTPDDDELTPGPGAPTGGRSRRPREGRNAIAPKYARFMS
jgi:hypothetical protein